MKPVTFHDVFAVAKKTATPEKIVVSPMRGLMDAAGTAINSGVRPPKIRSKCCGKVIR